MEQLNFRTAIALSVRQPWAWLIVNGWKDVENRNWSTSFRGHFLIHAAKGMTWGEWDECDRFARDAGHIEIPDFDVLQRGGIVGEAYLVDCVQQSLSRWFVGMYGFVMQGARPLPFRPCRGQLGFFVVAA